MAVRLYDDFDRNTTNALVELGTADSGTPWQRLSSAGSIGIIGNRARVDTAAASPLAVMDGDTNLGLVVMSLVGQGAGFALYGRVTDANNWWRCYHRIYNYQFQTGTEQYVSGYQQVQTGTEQYVSGTRQVQVGTKQTLIGYNYPAFMTYRQIYRSTGQLVPEGTPQRIAPYNEQKWANHPATTWLPPSAWPDILIPDQVTAMRAFDYVRQTPQPVYRTDPVYEQQPVYSTRPVYSSQPVYATRPVYATAIGHELRMQWAIAGTIRTYSVPSRAGVDRLRMTFTENRNAAFAIMGNEVVASVGTATDPAASGYTATKYGIGFTNDTDFITPEDAIDNFYFNPTITRRMQPSVLL